MDRSYFAEERPEDAIGITARAKQEISNIFEQHGVRAEIPARPGYSSPQLLLNTKGIGLWPRVQVQRRRFSPYTVLAEAAVFALHQSPRPLPCVIHKRPTDPYTITLYLEDFIHLLLMAEAAHAETEQQTEGS